jgi:hypothetical protein
MITTNGARSDERLGHAAEEKLAAEVKLPASTQVRDEHPARRALDALSWNTAVPADRIKLFIEDGWVTLEGRRLELPEICGLQHDGLFRTVFGFARPAHHEAGEPLYFCREPHRGGGRRRRGPQNSRHINVEKSGDHVTPHGTVASLAEREAVERAAWTKPAFAMSTTTSRLARRDDEWLAARFRNIRTASQK